jgi:hypothetical protein
MLLVLAVLAMIGSAAVIFQTADKPYTTGISAEVKTLPSGSS